MEVGMRQDEGHPTSDDIFIGIDLATKQHQVVILDSQGRRLTSFKVSHTREGLGELVQRCTSPLLLPGRGRAVIAFEATGHVWEAVAAFLEEQHLEYQIVNPLATFRTREARQMSRDKRDLTDAEQIAHLLRTGIVTQCQLLPDNYMQLRRAWGEYHRIRKERARLQTLLTHQLYGAFPEIVGEWKTVSAPGCLAVLRTALTPRQIAKLTKPAFIRLVHQHRRGRRMWRFKIEQVWEKACRTVAAPHGQEAAMREVARLVERIDFVGDQLDQVATELHVLLDKFEEAKYLATLPGIGWVTVAALIAEIGPFDRYRHGRQLVKLAGLQPSRRESGQVAGRTPITKRGRAQLRAVVYMATLSSLQHNPRIKAHYERLCQRTTRPLPKMHAFGACMSKLLMYAFAGHRRRGGYALRCREHFTLKTARSTSAWHPPLLGNKSG
jgi:transposase